MKRYVAKITRSRRYGGFVRRLLFPAAVTFLLLSVACGGGGSGAVGSGGNGSGGNGSGGNGSGSGAGGGDITAPPVVVAIDLIAPPAPEVITGGTVTFTLAPRNTEIIWPAATEVAGSYTRDGNTVTWTLPLLTAPDEYGEYGFTVKASADPSKTLTVTVTVIPFAEVFDFPGAAHTMVTAVADDGTVVGSYKTSADITYGFYKTPAGDYRSLGVPQARHTWAEGVASTGKIIGSYVVHDDVTGSDRVYGFVYTPDGSYKRVAYPGTDETWLYGGNDADQLVGYFFDAAERRYRGFIYDAASDWFAVLDVDPTANTYAVAINNYGQIVGYYEDADGICHAFLKNDTAYNIFDYTAAYATEALDINDAGQIVGGYEDRALAWHSFWRGDEISYTVIAYPGARETVLTGINGAGQLAGYYIDASDATHGFVK